MAETSLSFPTGISIFFLGFNRLDTLLCTSSLVNVNAYLSIGKSRTWRGQVISLFACQPSQRHVHDTYQMEYTPVPSPTRFALSQESHSRTPSQSHVTPANAESREVDIGWLHIPCAGNPRSIQTSPKCPERSVSHCISMSPCASQPLQSEIPTRVAGQDALPIFPSFRRAIYILHLAQPRERRSVLQDRVPWKRPSMHRP